MQLHIVPAAHGMLWLRQSFKNFKKRPFAITGLFFMMILLLNLVSFVPGIGPLLSLVLFPAFTLGFMNATRIVLHDQYPMPTVLLSAFKQDAATTKAMVILGVCYAATVVGSMAFTQVFDGGQFMRMYIGGEDVSQAQFYELVRQGDFQMAAMSAGVLLLLSGMFYWHASALVYWHRVPAIKSMFFSAVACFRNLPAFVVFLGCWMLVSLALAATTALFLMAVLGSSIGSMVSFMGVMLICVIFFAAQYFSYQDCFVEAQDSKVQTLQ